MFAQPFPQHFRRENNTISPRSSFSLTLDRPPSFMKRERAIGMFIRKPKVTRFYLVEAVTADSHAEHAAVSELLYRHCLLRR
jgi:hypothetical protein